MKQIRKNIQAQLEQQDPHRIERPISAQPTSVQKIGVRQVKPQKIQATYRYYAPVYDAVFGWLLQDGRQLLAQHVNAQQPKQLLEIGSGTGLTLAHYAPAIAVTGVDFSEQMLVHARTRAQLRPSGAAPVELLCLNAEKLPFADHSFDCVVLPHVYSVTPDPAQLAAEVRRVCAPNGLIFVLNHFSAQSSSRWTPWLNQYGLRLGFRPYFPYLEHVQNQPWTVQARYSVNRLLTCDLVVIRNAV